MFGSDSSDCQLQEKRVKTNFRFKVSRHFRGGKKWTHPPLMKVIIALCVAGKRSFGVGLIYTNHSVICALCLTRPPTPGPIQVYYGMSAEQLTGFNMHLICQTTVWR